MEDTDYAEENELYHSPSRWVFDSYSLYYLWDALTFILTKFFQLHLRNVGK